MKKLQDKCQNCGCTIIGKIYHVMYAMGFSGPCMMIVGECCIDLFEED